VVTEVVVDVNEVVVIVVVVDGTVVVVEALVVVSLETPATALKMIAANKIVFQLPVILGGSCV
jgi:hypothetical protein